MGLPLARHRPAAAGSRVPRRGAGPDRLRPVGEAPRPQRAHPRQPHGQPGRAAGAARPAGRHVRLPRLGRPHRARRAADPAGPRRRHRGDVHLGVGQPVFRVPPRRSPVALDARPAGRALPAGPPRGHAGPRDVLVRGRPGALRRALAGRIHRRARRSRRACADVDLAPFDPDRAPVGPDNATFRLAGGRGARSAAARHGDLGPRGRRLHPRCVRRTLARALAARRGHAPRHRQALLAGGLRRRDRQAAGRVRRRHR